MDSELLFRIAFFTLLGLVLAVRVDFTQRVPKAGSTFSLIRLVSYNDWSDGRYLLKRNLRRKY
jgi:hypothetical protein